MNRIIYFPILLTILVLIILSAGCSKNNETPPSFAVTAISPVEGSVGTEVTIKGNQFGTDINLVKVSFSGTNAVVNAVIDSEIKAVVPLRAGSGEVKVTVGGKEVSGTSFNYIISEKDIANTIWSGEMTRIISGRNYHEVYSMELKPDGTLYWYESKQGYKEVENSGEWRVKSGQLTIFFIKPGLPVRLISIKSSITNDFKLTAIQNEAGEDLNLTSGELIPPPLTQLNLNGTTWVNGTQLLTFTNYQEAFLTNPNIIYESIGPCKWNSGALRFPMFPDYDETMTLYAFYIITADGTFRDNGSGKFKKTD